MTKKTIAFALIAFAALAIYAVGASAHTTPQASGTYHEEMENTIETGTYDDLVVLRDQYDRPFMRWVDSPEDFELAREHHEAMEESGETGFGHMGQRGSGMMRNQGTGFMGADCPMMGGI